MCAELTEEEFRKNFQEIYGSNDDYVRAIISTHAFQETLSQSEEFYDILSFIRSKTRIAAMRDKAMGTNYAPLYANKVLNDEGKTYDDVNPTTLYLVSEEFYNLHKNEIGEMLGENLNILNKFTSEKANVYNFEMKEIIDENSERTKFKCKEYFGSEGFIAFIGELCKGHKVEVGDKIFYTEKNVEDPKFGELEKRDAFLYDDGKLKHFYQSYSPLQNNTIEATVEITKAIQNRTKIRQKEGNEK